MAAKILARARTERPDLRPNGDPEIVARTLGYQVKLTSKLPPGTDGTWRRPTMARPFAEIYVSSLIGPCRRAYTVAHELLEAHLPFRDGVCTIPERYKERWCNRGAAGVLMPPKDFLASGQACSWDLETLRAWWPFCSWAALVARMSELVPATAAAAWHQQRDRFQRTHRSVDLPEHADALEEFVAAEALQTGQSEILLGGLEIRAWRSGPGRAVSVVRRVG